MKIFFENRQNSRSEGLVVDLNERLFFYLSKISIFELVRKNKRIKNMHNFVDIWVISNLLISVIMSCIIFKFVTNKIFLTIFFLYAYLRVFEIIIYQINVNLFDRYRYKLKNKDYSIKSPTRTVVLLLYNYIEIIFWYVIMITSILKLFDFQNILIYRNYIKSSFLCLINLDYGVVAGIIEEQKTSLSTLISSIAMIEFGSGLVMTIISLANFIGKLPSEYKKEHNRRRIRR